MGIIGNPLLLGEESGPGPSDYQIPRSLRFNSADSAYLNRTPSAAGNRKTWTWSGWVKRSGLGTRQMIFGNLNAGATLGFDVEFIANDSLDIYDYSSGYEARKNTTQVFRDCSAWYHIAINYDSTNATAADRLRLYVNGSRVTAFAVSADPALNADGRFNTAVETSIGRSGAYNLLYLSGYLADVHFIDGQALDPTSFGEFDDNGVWQPKAYSGTYGTNGFHLPFSDNSTAAALGTDTSGNGNDWTPNNLSIGGSLVPISSATGAIPALNTTDTYGRVLGTGVRSDAFAANLELCLPLTVTGGRLLSDDVIPSGRTSGVKTVTLSNLTTSSTNYAFYGSSLRNTSTSHSCIDLPGRIITYGGAFTIECWVYRGPGQGVGLYSDGNKVSLLWLSIGVSSNGVLDFYSYSGARSNPGSLTVPENTWTHVAFVTNGSTVNYYVNGVKDPITRSWVSPYGSTGQYQALFNNTNNVYAQDYRIYTGIQKYTSSFTPPKPLLSAAEAIGNDSLVDSPTNYGEDTAGAGGEVRGNYCTLNPLDIIVGNGVSSVNGNLDVTLANASIKGTVAIPVAGKWYFEVTITRLYSSAFGGNIGIVKSGTSSWSGVYPTTGVDAPGIYKNSSRVEAISGVAVNDIFGVAVNMDSMTLQIYKNNTAFGSSVSIDAATYLPYIGGNGNNTGDGGQFVANFGQRPFAYTAPSGFKALCTTNLPEPTIADGSTAMDVALYTGNGSTQTISGLNFSPDLVWIKNRSSTPWHMLFNVISGPGRELYSNSTAAENTTNNQYGYLSAFNADGFTVTAGATDASNVNASGNAYVAWTWDAGSSTVTDDAGSIESQVRANPSAGFSVVSWTGNGDASASVAHGLGVAPRLYFTKCRDSIGGVLDNWGAFTTATGSMSYGFLNTTAAFGAPGQTAPTSSTINVVNGFDNVSEKRYVAYCFAPVAGYSAFGSYTGNGSADGPFVYTGHRSRFLMVKRTDSNNANTAHWFMYDSARNSYNVTNNWVAANLSNAEAGTSTLDLLSNGFKWRDIGTAVNANGGTYIWASFAEHPFATSRAR